MIIDKFRVSNFPGRVNDSIGRDDSNHDVVFINETEWLRISRSILLFRQNRTQSSTRRKLSIERKYRRSSANRRTKQKIHSILKRKQSSSEFQRYYLRRKTIDDEYLSVFFIDRYRPNKETEIRRKLIVVVLVSAFVVELFSFCLRPFVFDWQRRVCAFLVVFDEPENKFRFNENIFTDKKSR